MDLLESTADSSYASELQKRTADVFSVRNKKDDASLGLSLLESNKTNYPHSVSYKDYMNSAGQKLTFIQSAQNAYLQVDGTLIKSETEELNLNSFKKTTDSGSLLAPVPGKLIEVIFNEGSELKKVKYVILESMKMEFEVKSSKDGIIDKILVKRVPR